MLFATYPMDEQATETGSLSNYRAVLARRKWIIILNRPAFPGGSNP